jgi:hypothetical protein
MNFSHVFVLSMPRSGSTLLRLLLDNVPGCVSLPETHFLVFYDKHKSINISVKKNREIVIENWLNYFTTKKIINDLGILKEELLTNVKTHKDIFDITVARYLYENNKINIKWLIEKSPPHIFFQHHIKSLFPTYRAIYLIRDPRDVAGSMLNKSWATHNIYTIARSWNKSTQLINKLQNGIILRYEDLSLKKSDALQRINGFFETNITENQFYTIDNSRTKGINLNFQTNLVEPISSKNMGKWKIQLSKIDRECQIIEIVCRDQMIKYEYEISKDKKDFKSYINLFFEMLRFMANKIFS